MSEGTGEHQAQMLEFMLGGVFVHSGPSAAPDGWKGV